jgi:hypothetical protein
MRQAAFIWLGLALLFLGCDDTPPASPRISLEKWDIEKRCFAHCGKTEPAPELGLVDHCAMPAASCELLGGADKLRVIVDYSHILFDITTNVTPPTLMLHLGDREVPLQTPIVSTRYADTKSVYFLSVFYAPPQPAERFAVLAKGADGYFGQTDFFALLPPRIAINLPGCTMNPGCTMLADVGTAQIDISAPPGFAPLEGVVTSKLDGILQLQSAAVTLQPGAGDLLSGLARLVVPVPMSSTGRPINYWEITAAFGSTIGRYNVDLLEPPMSVVIRGCPIPPDGRPQPPCTLPADSNTVIDFNVPRGLNETTAQLTATLDGVPTTLQQSGGYVVSGLSTQTFSTTVTLPNSPGSVFIATGRTGPYSRQSTTVTLAP